MALITGATHLSQVIMDARINNIPVNTLIAMGSTESFIISVIQQLGLPISPTAGIVSMASSLSSKIRDTCSVDLLMDNKTYPNVKLAILHNLCCDILLDHDFLWWHLHFHLIWRTLTWTVCGLVAIGIYPLSLFTNLSPDYKPIPIKSLCFSDTDKIFIASETKRLLQEGVIEPSDSSWRVQVLVTLGANHKWRIVVDYSQTINR